MSDPRSTDPFLDGDNDEKEIEAQLRSSLREDVGRRLQCRRPLVTHLNADTTWLLSLPVPSQNVHSTIKKRKRGAEGVKEEDKEIIDPRRRAAYFHILIDPWLKGGQSDVAKFFSQQWHAQESAVQTIAEVEEVIGDIEDLASSRTASPSPSEAQRQSRAAIDAVVVSHEFTDHMHKETLLEVPGSVPVFASFKAAGIIKSWQHFDVVVTLPTNLTGTNRDWRATSVEPLPSWLGISRLGQDKIDLLYYHSAVMFAFSGSAAKDSESDDDKPAAGEEEEQEEEDEKEDREEAEEDEENEENAAEAIIYTPHGITPEDLHPIAHASPPIRTLALLHGLHDVRIGPQLNLGAHNGLKVQRLTHAKYWLSTHDEAKTGGGLVSWVLKRQVYTVKDAIEKEVREKGADSVDESLKDVRFVELGNGESLILE